MSCFECNGLRKAHSHNKHMLYPTPFLVVTLVCSKSPSSISVGAGSVSRASRSGAAVPRPVGTSQPASESRGRS